jgi:hypothetical protein
MSVSNSNQAFILFGSTYWAPSNHHHPFAETRSSRKVSFHDRSLVIEAESVVPAAGQNTAVRFRGPKGFSKAVMPRSGRRSTGPKSPK